MMAEILVDRLDRQFRAAIGIGFGQLHVPVPRDADQRIPHQGRELERAGAGINRQDHNRVRTGVGRIIPGIDAEKGDVVDAGLGNARIGTQFRSRREIHRLKPDKQEAGEADHRDDREDQKLPEDAPEAAERPELLFGLGGLPFPGFLFPAAFFGGRPGLWGFVVIGPIVITAAVIAVIAAVAVIIAVSAIVIAVTVVVTIVITVIVAFAVAGGISAIIGCV